MQPAAAIPPLTEEGIKTLVGLRVAVPRESNPSRRWWVSIRRVIWCGPVDAVVEVEGGTNFGQVKRFPLSKLQWRGQVYDPLLIALRKARATR